MKHLTIVIAIVMVVFACGTNEKKQPIAAAEKKSDKKELFKAPDTNSLGNDSWSNLVRYGARLVRHTAYFIGPEGTVRKNLGNKMNCTNCHLEAGTKPFALNFFDSHKIYPQYRARENAILTMSD